MTKFTNKPHLMIIVSAVILAIGIAVGLICHFSAGGFFNFAEEYKSYKAVTVSYAYVDYNDDDVVADICDKEFKAQGVSHYDDMYGETTEGGEITFKFRKSCSDEKLSAAVESINAVIKAEGSGLSDARVFAVETKLGSGNALIYCAIALSAAVVFQFIYFAIRYTLNGACAAFLANLHNLCIFLAYMAITRAPFGSAAFAFAAITVLATIISSCHYFDRVRKNSKELSSLSAAGICETSAKESLFPITVIALGLELTGLLFFVLMSISSLSAYLVLGAALGAALSGAATMYGSAIFIPAVHPVFKRIADNYKSAHGKGVKVVKG